jgi:hypothetical protein
MSRFLNSAQISTFQKNVTTSGTPVQLDALTIPEGASLTVKAKRGNSGVITIGGSSSQSLNSGTSHFALLPSQSVTVQVTDASAVWIDSTVSGEGIEAIVEF